MNDLVTIEERLASVEEALRTSIIFNMNAAGVLGRRLAFGNDAIANAIAQDLKALKNVQIDGANKQLHDQYVDSLVTVITGRA